jgi:hypothetical protein
MILSSGFVEEEKAFRVIGTMGCVIGFLITAVLYLFLSKGQYKK